MKQKHLPIILFSVLLVSPVWAQESTNLARPNVIVILCDDLGQGDPGCYNPDSKISTPNMDRLAKEGMRFTDAHTPSSVCTPTRYSTLTGRYCWRSRLKKGVLWNGWAQALIEDGRPTIASMLKPHGYHSSAIGKWHLGWNWQANDGNEITANYHPANAVNYVAQVNRGPGSLGFDACYLIPASLDMAPYLWLVDDCAQQAPTNHTPGSARRWSGGGGFWREGPIAPGFDFYDVVPSTTEQSVAYIEQRAAAQRKGGDKPFFLYLPMPAPHTPWMPTPEFQGDTKVGWYGDFVAQTDKALGRILAALDRNGLSENTIVIFTSDNGSHWPDKQIETFNHDANNGWRGQKADIWEAGHRVPFIIRWPTVIQAGTVTDQTICLTDIYATLAEIVGHDLAFDEGEDSVSLLPILDGTADAPVRKTIVHHSLNGTFAIRRGDWKLVVDNLGSGGFSHPPNIRPGQDDVPATPGGQLYNLSSDPAEQHNVWADRPKIVKDLRNLLVQYQDTDRSDKAP